MFFFALCLIPDLSSCKWLCSYNRDFGLRSISSLLSILLKPYLTYCYKSNHPRIKWFYKIRSISEISLFCHSLASQIGLRMLKIETLKSLLNEGALLKFISCWGWIMKMPDSLTEAGVASLQLFAILTPTTSRVFKRVKSLMELSYISKISDSLYCNVIDTFAYVCTI